MRAVLPRLRYTQTVTRLRPQPLDRNGDPTGPAAEQDIPGCVIWPAGSSEQTYQQDTVASGFQVEMPADCDILPTDQVRWNDNVYDIDGDPEPHQNPFTGTRVLVVTIRRAA